MIQQQAADGNFCYQPGEGIPFSKKPKTQLAYRASGGLAERRWNLVEVSEEFQPLPKGEPDVYYQVWVYRVSP